VNPSRIFIERPVAATSTLTPAEGLHGSATEPWTEPA